MNLKNKDKVILIVLFLVSVIFFVQGLNLHGIEYRDDEIFYYKSTQEMVQNNNLLSPTYFGENRFQKPILFYWLVILSYKIFGINWFAARLVAVIFASLIVVLTWIMAKNFFDRRTAALSCLILVTMPLFFRHAKNVVPDIPLTFFIVLSIFCAAKFIEDPDNRKYSILFFVSCALGFMIKGFTSLIFPLLVFVVYSLVTKKRDLLSKINFPLGVVIITAIILPWFLFMIKVHGQEYIDYMLKVETQSRVLAPDWENNLLTVTATFFRNALFYLQTMFNYFSPWSLFAVVAIPFSVYRSVTNHKDKDALSFFWLWFLIVYLFFSIIVFRMSHYMLALAVPFAILVSYFLLQVFSDSLKARAVKFIRKFIFQIMIFFSTLGFAFFYVFLLKVNVSWLVLLICVYVGLAVFVQKNKNPLVAPLVLGGLLFFAYFQSNVLATVGVSAHSTLQRFAKTINKDPEKFVIGVGSNDIHEKEFQVYFDQNVQKAATYSSEETKAKLATLFSVNDKVYCLLMKKDFDTFYQSYKTKSLEIVQADYIFRKRLYLNKDFFYSVLTLNREKVHDYLMEEVVLIKKDQGV